VPHLRPPSELSRARGCLLGLAVGDALGAPLEGAAAADARDAVEHGIELSGGGIWAPGEWTDDTALALRLAESIGERGLLDTEDVAHRYIEWAASGAKGIGKTTRTALMGAIDAGDARARAAHFHESVALTAGNGTVMRAAPIGLAAATVGQATRAAREDAILTHADPAAGTASAALCAALVALRTGADPIAAAEREASVQPRVRTALEAARQSSGAAVASLAAGPERGACWTTLAVAMRALGSADDYERGVLSVIALGGDVDTNAAVAGAVLGCRYGVEAIPARWLSQLRERQRIDQAARQLVTRGE